MSTAKGAPGAKKELRFGIGSFAYRWSVGRSYFRPSRPLTLEGFLDKAIRLKVQGVMVCNNFPLETYPARRLRDIRALVEKNGMFLETGARGKGTEDFLKLLTASEEIGSRLLRIVPEINRELPPVQVRAQLAACEKYLRPVLKEARKKRITLALENYFGMYTEEMVRMIRKLDDDYFGACIDTSNSAILMENPLQVTRALAPYAKSLHVKDFKPELNPRGNFFLGVALGDGIVDFLQVLSILERHHYKGNTNLELYIDRRETEKETLAWEEACVKKSVRYAHKVLGFKPRQ